MEFVKLADEFNFVEINTTAAREHVGEIERSHRTLKERARCVVSDLPYTVLPMQMVIHLVYFVVLWLNAFPNKQGISENLSPREIVTRKKISFVKHCKALFGSYVEATEDADITNDMKPRTRECIALGPTGNRQGSQKVLCLRTGTVLTRRRIDEYPMPNRVIKKVNDLGRRSKRERFGRDLEFLNRKKEKYDWDSAELAEDGMVLLEDEGSHPDIPAEMPGIEMEDEQIGPIPAVEDAENSDAEMATAAALNANIPVGTGTEQTQSIDCDIPGVDITGVPTIDEEDDDIDVIQGPETIPPLITEIDDDDETIVAPRPTRNRTVPT
jgi:hypothetical protein